MYLNNLSFFSPQGGERVALATKQLAWSSRGFTVLLIYILQKGPTPAVKWLEPRSSSRRSEHLITASTVNPYQGNIIGEHHEICN